MPKLFKTDLPLQTFVSTPGDLTAVISNDGSQYFLELSLPVGVMSFSGSTGVELADDIIAAIRKMSNPLIPSIGIKAAAELLTDVETYVDKLNLEMDEELKANSPEDIFKNIFGGALKQSELQVPESLQNLFEGGPVRIMFISSPEDDAEELIPQPTIKHYS